jgi:hypothetical protein
VQAAIDIATNHQTKRARRDRSVFGCESTVSLENACRVGCNGTSVQQIPQFAVGVDGLGADHPGVAEIEPTFARPVDLAAGLGQQYCLTLMNGDLRWADLNLECHAACPSIPCSCDQSNVWWCRSLTTAYLSLPAVA